MAVAGQDRSVKIIRGHQGDIRQNRTYKQQYFNKYFPSAVFTFVSFSVCLSLEIILRLFSHLSCHLNGPKLCYYLTVRTQYLRMSWRQSQFLT